jgi:hypothetical protein
VTDTRCQSDRLGHFIHYRHAAFAPGRWLHCIVAATSHVQKSAPCSRTGTKCADMHANCATRAPAASRSAASMLWASASWRPSSLPASSASEAASSDSDLPCSPVSKSESTPSLPLSLSSLMASETTSWPLLAALSIRLRLVLDRWSRPSGRAACESAASSLSFCTPAMSDPLGLSPSLSSASSPVPMPSDDDEAASECDCARAARLLRRARYASSSSSMLGLSRCRSGTRLQPAPAKCRGDGKTKDVGMADRHRALQGCMPLWRLDTKSLQQCVLRLLCEHNRRCNKNSSWHAQPACNVEAAF